MFAMVLLTFVVGVITFISRVQSVKSKTVNHRAYRLMEQEQFSEIVIKTSRNFSNLFEVPVLFYVACVSYLALEIESTLAIYLAWSFFILRMAHSVIHISYNHLMHRIAAFLSSSLLVLALWIMLISKIS